MRFKAEKHRSITAFGAGITSRSFVSFVTSLMLNILDSCSFPSISMRSLIVNLSGMYSMAFAAVCK